MLSLDSELFRGWQRQAFDADPVHLLADSRRRSRTSSGIMVEWTPSRLGIA